MMIHPDFVALGLALGFAAGLLSRTKWELLWFTTLVAVTMIVVMLY